MKLILGTMNFGPQLDMAQSREMIDQFLLSGNKELDTAYVYNGGETENILGEILSNITNYSIATKVHPRITGRLDGKTIELELRESLLRMKLKTIDLLYFHFPDAKTPIIDALETVARLIEAGIIRGFGLSNYPAWQVVDICHMCDKKGIPRPYVYQGMYNALCRNVEPELFPALREFGLKFYAFNPLAGGMLSGKHKDYASTPEPGRFSRLKSYRERYWNISYFEAVNMIRDVCLKEDIQMAEAAYRWLVHHSLLREELEDGIIIGASSLQQLKSNMEFSSKGQLPDSIISAMDEAWRIAKPESPSYFKFF